VFFGVIRTRVSRVSVQKNIFFQKKISKSLVVELFCVLLQRISIGKGSCRRLSSLYPYYALEKNTQRLLTANAAFRFILEEHFYLS
jgi:hypothetical protein